MKDLGITFPVLVKPPLLYEVDLPDPNADGRWDRVAPRVLAECRAATDKGRMGPMGPGGAMGRRGMMGPGMMGPGMMGPGMTGAV